MLLVEEHDELKIQLGQFYSPEKMIPDIFLDDIECVDEVKRYQDAALPVVASEEVIQHQFTIRKRCVQGIVHSIMEGNQDVVMGLLQEVIIESTDDQI